ncbi:MAG: hypothetical protein NVS9B3_01910 [Gemmatimonadaceae bacterium]
MVAKNPTNPLARFGLANELAKAGLDAEAVEHLEIYLAGHDDEGNGYLRLGDLLARLDRKDDAVAALRKGVAAAGRFGHAGLVNEIEARLDELA